MSFSSPLTSIKLAGFKSECTMRSSWIVLTAASICCSPSETEIIRNMLEVEKEIKEIKSRPNDTRQNELETWLHYHFFSLRNNAETHCPGSA